jgi:hypothetical protein
MKRIHAVLLIFGLSWLAVVLPVVFSNLILRETRLGVVAQLLDSLPPILSNVIFLLFGIVFCWVGQFLLGLGWDPFCVRALVKRIEGGLLS